VYVLCSCIHKVLLIMPLHHFYLLHPYPLYLFSCLQLFPFMLSSPQLRRKSVTIGSSAVAQSSLHLSHLLLVLMVGDVMWLIVESFFLHIVQSLFVSIFSLLVYWCVLVYFQKPKTDFTSPSLLTWLLSSLGCMGFSP
jgi:hypothetical protein